MFVSPPDPARRPGPAPPPGPSASPRARWIAGGVTLALLVGLIALAAAKLDLTQVGHALTHVNVAWVAAAIGLMASSFLARAESWFAVLGAAVPGNRIGRPAVRRGLLIGMIGSTVAPGRLGEAARTWVIARRLGNAGQHLAVVLGTVVSQTLINLLALAILAVVTLTGAALAGARTDALVAALALPAALLTVVLAGPRVLRRAARSRLAPLRRAGGLLSEQLVALRTGLTVFRRPRTVLHAAGAQLGGWVLQLGVCYAVIRALGLQDHANLAAAAAVLLAVNLTAIVPITPSNVGVFQAACLAVLAPFGVAATRGLAYGLILQAIEILAAFGLGVPALLREGISLADLRHATGARPEPESIGGPRPPDQA